MQGEPKFEPEPEPEPYVYGLLLDAQIHSDTHYSLQRRIVGVRGWGVRESERIQELDESGRVAVFE